MKRTTGIIAVSVAVLFCSLTGCTSQQDKGLSGGMELPVYIDTMFCLEAEIESLDKILHTLNPLATRTVSRHSPHIGSVYYDFQKSRDAAWSKLRRYYMRYALADYRGDRKKRLEFLRARLHAARIEFEWLLAQGQSRQAGVDFATQVGADGVVIGGASTIIWWVNTAGKKDIRKFLTAVGAGKNTSKAYAEAIYSVIKQPRCKRWTTIVTTAVAATLIYFIHQEETSKPGP